MPRVIELILWRDRIDPDTVLIGVARSLPHSGTNAWASTVLDGIGELFGLDVYHALQAAGKGESILIEVRAEVVKE